MLYPARFRRSDGVIVVTFPDIPEAITQGDDTADARRQALDAFETALDFYFEEGRSIPLPSTAKPSHKLIELPPSVAAKILLHNEMVRQKVRPIDLANRLGIPRQEVTRMLDWRHNTKIDTTAKALAALGKRLELHVA
jgi:antitoxin HicB